MHERATLVEFSVVVDRELDREGPASALGVARNELNSVGALREADSDVVIPLAVHAGTTRSPR